MESRLVTLVLIACAAGDIAFGNEGCISKGITYNIGDAVPSGDCNLCTCSGNNHLACTIMACHGCTSNGTYYNIGAAVPSGDCNQCTCAGNNRLACTLMACPDTDNCARPCPRSWHPVCGSDGRTYGNGCLFAEGKCRNRALKLAGLGECN